MLKVNATLLLFLSAFHLSAQIGPEITSWILNTTGATGYNGIASNVQQVRYSADNVYVSATCIPGYDIGPWTGNPNIPVNENFVFKITRHPQPNTGTLIATPLGHIGVWTNGVSIFNAKDAMSYNNQNVWHRNAIVAEGISFDNCLGHPAPNGEYHNHLNPTCLYDDSDQTKHSPLIGFAFDGYPIYGTYGFAKTDGTGGIKRMLTSYQLRNITARTTLADGTQLAANQYGPAISATYPLGLYVEDYEYVAGLGDLDEHNGRFGITPDYPNGTYAYFITLTTSGAPAYPYIIGPNYYGTVPAGNTGPQSGHNVPTEPVLNYTTAVQDVAGTESFDVYPNPAPGYFILENKTGDNTPWQISLFDQTGSLRRSWNETAVSSQKIDLESIPTGVYFLKVQAGSGSWTRKLIVGQ
jgi:hypothetical protein